LADLAGDDASAPVAGQLPGPGNRPVPELELEVKFTRGPAVVAVEASDASSGAAAVAADLIPLLSASEAEAYTQVNIGISGVYGLPGSFTAGAMPGASQFAISYQLPIADQHDAAVEAAHKAVENMTTDQGGSQSVISHVFPCVMVIFLLDIHHCYLIF
jgi:hypothetical protein